MPLCREINDLLLVDSLPFGKGVRNDENGASIMVFLRTVIPLPFGKFVTWAAVYWRAYIYISYIQEGFHTTFIDQPHEYVVVDRYVTTILTTSTQPSPQRTVSS